MATTNHECVGKALELLETGSVPSSSANSQAGPRSCGSPAKAASLALHRDAKDWAACAAAEKSAGLGSVALTDHNSAQGADALQRSRGGAYGRSGHSGLGGLDAFEMRYRRIMLSGGRRDGSA
jgi:hypothetical protein